MIRWATGAWIGAGVLLASILALTWLFLATADRATRHFERAAQSQSQLVQAIAIREAARARDSVRLGVLLADYRRALKREADTLPVPDRAAQADEIADAASLHHLVARSGPALDATVARIVRREQAEAEARGVDMHALRRRAVRYAILLAMVAALSATLGGVGLWSANRRLTSAVAARTRQIAAIDTSRRLFFAKVSHELKTPVTVIRGEAEVALATASGDVLALRGALHEVISQSELLNRRVEELLSLSQAEDGRLVLAHAPADLAALLHRAGSRVARQAASNEITLSTRIPDALPFRGDASWLEQAIVAVLDNAIKFSPAGSTVEIIARRRDGATAEIDIADRGTGVPPTALPRLFDAYYQTDEGRSRGGTGLGLALARWVVEQHGGTVAANRREGGGCRIAVALPVIETGAMA